MAWSDRLNPQVHTVWSGGWRPGAGEPPRILVDHELVLVARGSCELACAGRVHRLGPGDWLIVPPGAEHRSRCPGPAGCVRHCLHFDWDWTAEWSDGQRLWTWLPMRPPASELRPAPAWVPAGVLSGGGAQAAVAVAERLGLAWRAGRTAAVRLAALELLLQLTAPAGPAVPPQAALALRVKDLLDRHGHGTPALRRELPRLGRSYAHLCRCFRRAYGVAPLHYLHLRRIERAKELLAAGGASVAAVAREVGFDDPAYFTRVFRRLAGTSPRTWRAS